MKIDLRDIITFGGMGLIFTGGWLLYPPVALIMLGLCLYLLGMVTRS